MLRKLLLGFVCVACAVSTAWATDVEMGFGVGYSPGVYQDTDQLNEALAYHMKVAALVSPHIMAAIEGQVFSADFKADAVKTRMYTAQLAAKYFSKALYEKTATGSTRLHTLINPFIVVGGGLTDGEILGADINTFASYALGGGLRWDPTAATEDIAFDVFVSTTTGTSSTGEAQSYLTVYGELALQFKFLGL